MIKFRAVTVSGHKKNAVKWGKPTHNGLSDPVEIIYILRFALNNALYACMVASLKNRVFQQYRPYIFIRGNESDRINPPRRRRPLFVNYCDDSTTKSSEIIEYFTPL